MADALAAAQWLAERGMHVFDVDHPELSQCAGIRTAAHDPATCTDRGKHPCSKWSTVATTDRERVTAMFAGTTRNIGLACGPSGLLVVDEDSPDAFAKYAAGIGYQIPPTFTVTTGKGRHYYFAADGLELGNATGALKGHGVDVRGRGGYVVGPGSQHATGRRYTVENNAAVAACPAWLVEALTVRPASTEGRTGGFAGLPEVIRGKRRETNGERHDVLMRYATSLLAREVPLDEAEVLMAAAWRRCEQPPACETPMPWDEARALLADIYGRYPAGRSEGYRHTGPTVLDEPDVDGADEQNGGWHGLLQDGGAFLFDGPDEVEPIWGRGDEVLWAQGEALIIAGPPGVGKTTLAGQVVRARLGHATQVLGYPVRPTGSKVLYLAMDRPRQIRRSLLRQFLPEDRAAVAERLVVWKGPPPFDLAKFPGLLLDLARKAGADTVIVDSLKDAFLGLTDDEAAAGYNRARQTALTRGGVEVLELHHQRKIGANSAAPTTLADLYGSVWIGAGAGSVILLWGAPGDLIVQLRHLKQPVAEVGPFHILHDHDDGTSSIHRGADLVRLATIAGVDGLTVKAAACAMFDTDKPTDSQIEKARRRLRSLARPGGALVEQGGGRTGAPATYRAAIRALEDEVTGSRMGSRTLLAVTRSRPPRKGHGSPQTRRSQRSRLGSRGSRSLGVTHPPLPQSKGMRPPRRPAPTAAGRSTPSATKSTARRHDPPRRRGRLRPRRHRRER